MAAHPLTCLCIEKGREFADRVQHLFADPGVEITAEASLDRVLERFERQSFDIMLVTGTALKAGRLDGMEVLEVIAAKSPTTQVIFLITPPQIRMAMSALKAGSYQYARLPVADEELRLLIETAVERRPRYGPNLLLKQERQATRFEKLVGRSQVMQEAYRLIRQAAATDVPVLLTGETGTGKDLAAQAIHQQSPRADGPYVPVHIGALPPELVASELFGHQKGAFTGASEQHTGTFELAHRGTVFLDEISTIDEKMQVSLLRLIEQKKYRRIGGRKTITADVRLVAASNEDLQTLVRRNEFREDLFFRLDVFHITLPPLRERHGDIPLLIDCFLKRHNDEFQKEILGISPECVARLETYNWPGNVRELKNVIQRAVLVCQGEVLLPEHLPPRFRPEPETERTVTFPVGSPLREIEREMILQTLDHTGNNRTRTAEMLGLSRRALYDKIKRYGI